MNLKNKLYIIGITGIIIFAIGSLYLMKSVGLKGIMNDLQFFLSFFLIFCLPASLLCLLFASNISECEFRRNKIDRIRKENRQHMKRMENLENR